MRSDEIYESSLNRRSVLRKAAGAITGIGIGTVGGIAGTASAALPHGMSISGGGDLYYEISVNGNIEPDGKTEYNDEDHGSFVSGHIGSGFDGWDYSGDITDITMDGGGEVALYIGAGYDPSYKVDIYTEGSDYASYIWTQQGSITERDGAVDPGDHLTSDGKTHTVSGSVASASDKFYANGYPSYIYMGDSPNALHWAAHGY